MKVKAFMERLSELEIHPDMLPIISGMSPSDIQFNIDSGHIGYRLRSVIRAAGNLDYR